MRSVAQALLAVALLTAGSAAAAANPEARRLLIFGDSNAWGWKPVVEGMPTTRFAVEDTWPAVMAKMLGDGVVVEVDALSGRTVDQPYPEPVGSVPGELFSGRQFLPAVLASHLPLDWVLIALGTNDLRSDLNRTPEQIATGLRALADTVGAGAGGVGTLYKAPRVLILIPPAVGDVGKTPLKAVLEGASAKSRRLATAVRKAFAGRPEVVVDASELVSVNGVDGVHLTAEDHRLLGVRLTERLRPLLDAAPDEREHALPEALRYPNGIAADQDGSLYVGGITEGRIWRRNASGEWRPFFEGSPQVFAVTSLRLDSARRRLWGTSPDFLATANPRAHRVFLLHADTAALLQSWTLPDDGFSNDIALRPGGQALVTDSRNGRVLQFTAGASAPTVLLEDSRLAPTPGDIAIGVAGIAATPTGTIVLGHFGNGSLFTYDPSRPGGQPLHEMQLPARLQNPDGLQFAPDGSLLVLDGSITSGDGKLLRIVQPLEPGLRAIETLRQRLESPVNLAVAPDGSTWISESRIRHQLLPQMEGFLPQSFRLIQRLPRSAAP